MSSVIWPDAPLTAQDAQMFAELSDRLDALTEAEWDEWHRINDAINLAIIQAREDKHQWHIPTNNEKRLP